jgi:tRNA dimethylallyltransferase
MKNKICIVSGPTATGKTSTAIQLAKQYGGEIVNFDSLLLYQELNIGSAKPSLAEQKGIPHHMVGVESIKNPMNAASYMDKTLPLIHELHKQNKLVYLVGGSGFYLQALLYGMFKSGTTPKEILERSEELYQKQGITPFLAELKSHDPKSFERYHENDHYRIRRAVEHFWHNQSPFSESRETMMQKREDTSHMAKFNWDVHHIHLDLPKAEHFEIIQKRTQTMLEQGLIQEVQSILDQGFSKDLKPLQSIGYKETIDHLLGKLNQAEMIERINISTRQLAKSQRTWFKKIHKNTYHPLKEMVKLKKDFEEYLSHGN